MISLRVSSSPRFVGTREIAVRASASKASGNDEALAFFPVCVALGITLLRRVTCDGCGVAGMRKTGMGGMFSLAPWSTDSGNTEEKSHPVPTSGL